MDLTALPTDNLYKFMALSGVVIALFGVWFPWRKLGDIWSRVEQSELETESLRIDAKHLVKDIEAAEALADASPERVSDLRDKNREHERATALLAVRLRHHVRSIRQLWFVVILSAVLGLSGSGLAFFGFKLWYERLQGPLDATVRQENVG